MSAVFKAMCLMLFGILAVGFAWAQVSTGTIVGTVRDNNGGVVPNVTVTLTEIATGQVHETHTSDLGTFNAQFMPLGTYSVSAAATGFKTQVLNGITLQVDQTVNLTISLEVGSITQSVEVTAAAPLVDTTTSSLGQVIDNHEILSMPLNGRNPFALGLLVGNTAPVTGVATNLPFIGGGGQFSSNDVLLNGIDDNIFATAGNVGRQGIAIFPSVDAVDEFKVMTNNFSAEYGHAAGYIVAATIKSGTNQFHGAVFEFLRNDDFDANNYFTNRAGLPRSPYHQNQFGGTIGGPIRHDRIFFFGCQFCAHQRSLHRAGVFLAVRLFGLLKITGGAHQISIWDFVKLAERFQFIWRRLLCVTPFKLRKIGIRNSGSFFHLSQAVAAKFSDVPKFVG